MGTWVAGDSLAGPWVDPSRAAVGKSRSLMQPQELAQRLLPADQYRQIHNLATAGAPADCGPPWEREVQQYALAAGPHVSAITPENAAVIWEDIRYQEAAGFVRVLPLERLLKEGYPEELKVSRVAMVPQANRRGRVILNLSAQVLIPGSRRRRKRTAPSVNETSRDADDQRAVQRLGYAMPAILQFMFEVDCAWEIAWQKIDLSDGFWRMLVEAGKELNFVFEMPRRPHDATRHFVVPSALQMGWKNSPAYFCTATDAGRTLIRRFLAFSARSPGQHPHPLEEHTTDLTPPQGRPPSPVHQVRVLLLVFVDDFINALAGPPNRRDRPTEERWLAQAALHAIHAIFPPPDVVRHHGGKDSISRKKLERGDAKLEPRKETLGVHVNGAPGAARAVALPADKAQRYIQAIDEALASPAYRVSLVRFQKILGKIIHASLVMPSARGFMTPLYAQLPGKAPGDFIGLGRASEVREVLTDLRALLELAHQRPTHISELVPTDLPHAYAMMDASGVGLGGVMLPCTKWLPPSVWRLPMPPDLTAAVATGALSMVDCEFAAYFMSAILLEQIAHAHQVPLPGLNVHSFSDNSPTVHIVRRQAARAKSPMPARALRWLALRQRHHRTGPYTLQHWPGEGNTMADFASRSYEQGFDPSADAQFLTSFASRYPLPPQLGSWHSARAPTAAASAAFCLLRRIRDTEPRAPTLSGGPGVRLPRALASTLTSSASKDPASTWNESTCSWPLLLPCGNLVPTADSPHQGRRSSGRFGSADKSWPAEDLLTLGDRLRTPAPSMPA